MPAHALYCPRNAEDGNPRQDLGSIPTSYANVRTLWWADLFFKFSFRTQNRIALMHCTRVYARTLILRPHQAMLFGASCIYVESSKF